MTAHAAVGIDDDLAAGKSGVAHRSADDETARGVDVVLGIRVQKLRRNDGLDDVFQDLRTQCFIGYVFIVLGGDHDGIDTAGLAYLCILHRDLALAIRAQIRHQPGLANLRQLGGELVRQRDWQRHQLRSLVGGVPEHHALVAGSAGVDTLRNVRRLLVDRRNDRAGVGVETIRRVRIADLRKP